MRFHSFVTGIVLAAAGAMLVPPAAAPSWAAIWHILPDGSGDAPTIQAGIDSASAGDTVLVACGEYFEHGIVMKSGLVLRSEKDGPECAVIDALALGTAVFCEGVDAAARIEGFTITSGLAGGASPYNSGGGIFCRGSSLTIADCLFTGNNAPARGGGVFLYQGSNAVLTGCAFRDNSASFGGAVACQDSPAPHLEGNDFTHNWAHYGGAVYCEEGSSPQVTACVFLTNTAVYGGCAASLDVSAPTFTGCRFTDNTADLQGAVFWSTQTSAPGLDGCTLEGNSAPEGAAAYLEGESVWHATGCTLASNDGAATGTIFVRDGATARLESCITAFAPAGAAVWCEGSGAAAELACCDVYGNAGGDWTGCLAGQMGVAGNFAADPLFCDAPAGDFTLDASSPCLPGHHPGGEACGTIGAWGAGCGVTAAVPSSWGAVKRAFTTP